MHSSLFSFSPAATIFSLFPQTPTKNNRANNSFYFEIKNRGWPSPSVPPLELIFKHDFCRNPSQKRTARVLWPMRCSWQVMKIAVNLVTYSASFLPSPSPPPLFFFPTSRDQCQDCVWFEDFDPTLAFFSYSLLSQSKVTYLISFRSSLSIMMKKSQESDISWLVMWFIYFL